SAHGAAGARPRRRPAATPPRPRRPEPLAPPRPRRPRPLAPLRLPPSRAHARAGLGPPPGKRWREAPRHPAPATRGTPPLPRAAPRHPRLHRPPAPPPPTGPPGPWRSHVPHRPRLDLRDTAEVRVLGAERVRRPRRLHDRAAHRLAAALQLPPCAYRGGLR